MTLAYHHGDLKAALTAIARTHVAEHGADNLSLRDISREAGVSHAAAYRHFPDKGALLAEVATQGFDELIQVCETAAALHPADPVQQLGACGVAYVMFGHQHPRLLTLMFASAGRYEDYPALKTARAAAFGVLHRVITDGQAKGAIKNQDTKSLALSCWALVHGLATLLALENASGDWVQSAARKSVGHLIDGLRLVDAPDA
jgi:AcrR family transcriptional regulator